MGSVIESGAAIGALGLCGALAATWDPRARLCTSTEGVPTAGAASPAPIGSAKFLAVAGAFVGTGGGFCNVTGGVAGGSCASGSCAWTGDNADAGTGSTAGNCASAGCTMVARGAPALFLASCGILTWSSIGPVTVAMALTIGCEPRAKVPFDLGSLFFAGAVAAGVPTEVTILGCTLRPVLDRAVALLVVCGKAAFWASGRFSATRGAGLVFPFGAPAADWRSASTWANGCGPGTLTV